MSKPSQQFSPEIIAQIAVVILSRPLSMVNKMSFRDACAQAHNLLVAAERSNTERAAALEAAGNVEEETQQPTRAAYSRHARPADIIPPAVRVVEQD
jgi:hypothetical protein